MAQRMKAVAAGAAGLVGGAIATRRGLAGRRRSAGGEVRVQAVTVLAPLDEVRSAWDARSASAGLPAVELELRPAPGERGTEVIARLQDEDEPEASGAKERVKGEAPHQRLRAELRRFKSMVECGTLVSTEGQPTGRGPGQEAATQAVTDRLRAWGAA